MPFKAKKAQKQAGTHGVVNNSIRTVLFIAVTIIMFLALFGFINQREVLEKTVNAGLDVANSSGNLLTNEITGDGIFDITDDGVYIKGHTPDDVEAQKQSEEEEKKNKEQEKDINTQEDETEEDLNSSIEW